MFETRMQSNIDDILANLTELEGTQIPFALAHALTVTAHEGRKEVVAEMPDRFHIRTPRTPKGVRVQQAQRRDKSPSAAVFTRDWYMQDQEAGGTRRPRGGGNIWVPTVEARAGGSIEGRVLARYYPKNIKKNLEKGRSERRKKPGQGRYALPRPFVVDTSTGRHVYIRQDERRLPIVRLYSLAERAVIPARWDFVKTMTRVSGKQLRQQFIRSLDKALKGARGGPIKSNYVDYLAEHGGMPGDILAATPTFAQTLADNG